MAVFFFLSFLFFPTSFFQGRVSRRRRRRNGILKSAFFSVPKPTSPTFLLLLVCARKRNHWPLPALWRIGSSGGGSGGGRTQKISLDADYPILFRVATIGCCRDTCHIAGEGVARISGYAWLDPTRVTTRVAASGSFAGPEIS